MLIDRSVETSWCKLRDTLLNVSLATLGTNKRKHQDWFDENDLEVQQLLADRNKARDKLLSSRATRANKAAYREACRRLQQKREN